MDITKIGYDIDGTHANFIQGFTRYASLASGGKYDVISDDRELEHYDLSKMYSSDVVQQTWDQIHDNPMFYKSLEPLNQWWIEDTQELTQRPDVETHYITAREHPTNIFHQTREWLNRHGLEGKLHMSSQKAKRSHELGLDFFLDNKPEVIDKINRATDTKAVGLAKRYNVDEDIPTVDTVPHFNNMVRKYMQD